MESISQYPHIEFDRKAVSKRAIETRSILTGLSLVAKHPDGEHRLYCNDGKDEYWQYAFAWNWGAKPYCFIVPKIDPEDWKAQRYVDPDELLIYCAVMEQYLSIPTNRKIPNLSQHIQSLQQCARLPKEPEGRWFGPYNKESIVPDCEKLSET